MNELTITPGFYKHWKGQIYYVSEVHIRRDTAPFVVYSACYGDNSLYTRPVSEWFDVMGQKENGEPLYRFEKIKYEVAEVRHGEWKPYYEVAEVFTGESLNIVEREVQMGWECSVCGRYSPGDPAEMPYCHCGAKMDGGTEDGK